MTAEQAARLSQAVRDSLDEDDGETVVHIEIKEMADGSGSWGVFTTTVDAANSESLYRTVANREGEIVGHESEAI